MPGVASTSTLSDSDVVARVRAGEPALFEILMRRHNQRIYRTVRAVIRNEHEVEDVMQQAYINAFMHLNQFEERAQFASWLTRIALNEAFRRRRKMRLTHSREDVPSNVDADREPFVETVESTQPDPERQAYTLELRHILEDAVDALPDSYRTVFMLRDIEGLSTSETGADLGLGEEAVKTRLHRARALVRRAVTAHIGEGMAAAFQFHAPRCDRVVAEVLATIALPDPSG